MAVLALVIFGVAMTLLASVRSYIHWRRTGEVFAPAPAATGSPGWWAQLLSTLGIACAMAGPVAALLGLAPIRVLDHPFVQSAGTVIAVAGTAFGFAAQSAMGTAWSIDVDPEARTPLVTTGPFRLVRNPIFTCTAAIAFGLAPHGPEHASGCGGGDVRRRATGPGWPGGGALPRTNPW